MGGPLPLRGINRWQWRPLEHLPGCGQLLLELQELVLQTGNLLMAIPQLLEGIHKRIGIHGSKRTDLLAPTPGQGVAVSLEISSVQAFQTIKSFFAVGLFPAIGEPLTELLLVNLQFLEDSLQTISWQQRFKQRRQLLDQLIAIEAVASRMEAACMCMSASSAFSSRSPAG